MTDRGRRDDLPALPPGEARQLATALQHAATDAVQGALEDADA